MSPEKLLETITKQGAPGRRFWERELEIGCDDVLRQVAQDGFMDEWIAKRNGRQVDVLRRNLGLNREGSSRKKKADLQSNDSQLLPYLLVQEFVKFKSKAATIEFAKTLLSSDLLDACGKGDDDFDTLALCFAIYQRDPQQPRAILHLDTVHKSGFARMKM